MYCSHLLLLLLFWYFLSYHRMCCMQFLCINCTHIYSCVCVFRFGETCVWTQRLAAWLGLRMLLFGNKHLSSKGNLFVRSQHLPPFYGECVWFCVFSCNMFVRLSFGPTNTFTRYLHIPPHAYNGGKQHETTVYF